MAWTVPTYAGAYMGGSPSNARLAMFDLCRAVHERQDAVGESRTSFKKADGTSTTSLVLADLANIRAAGASSPAKTNLALIRQAIVDLLATGKFTETSGRSDVLTKTTVEAALSIDLDTNATRQQDAGFWQGLQDALDMMIYAKRSVLVGDTETTTYSKNYPVGILPNASPDVAWTNMYGLSEDTFTSGAGEPFPKLSNLYSSGSGLWLAQSVRRVEDKKVVNTFDGVLTDVDFGLGLTVSTALDTTVNLTIDGLDTIDLLDHTGAVGEVVFPCTTIVTPLNDTSYLNMEIDVPATSPFNGTYPTYSAMQAGIIFGVRVYFYIDLATILTDQA